MREGAVPLLPLKHAFRPSLWIVLMTCCWDMACFHIPRDIHNKIFMLQLGKTNKQTKHHFSVTLPREMAFKIFRIKRKRLPIISTRPYGRMSSSLKLLSLLKAIPPSPPHSFGRR